MTRSVLVLQHAPWERPGLVAEALGPVPLDVRQVAGEGSPTLPDVRDLAGVVALGGPMGVDDVRFPGLAAEWRLLAEAVEHDVPVLGVCLGMQLLARALGAAVHPDHGTEIGFAPVDVVGSDPALGPLGARPTVLHWHGDAAELPAGATLLASTPTTPVQAFRAGSALGLQFHLELDAALLDEWLAAAACADDLARHGVTGLPEAAGRELPGLVPRSRAALAAAVAPMRERA